MWQLFIGLWIGGTIGVFVMALMNIASSSDERRTIITLHTTLVDLLQQSTGPDWDYQLVNGDNKEFLTKVVAVIESIKIISEDSPNETDN